MFNYMIEKILKLKHRRNAVILAHNYQLPEVHDIADYVGDSLGLSVQAAKTNADVIVFSGVRFMAETAKILSPEKIVLLPDPDAGCPMADMITTDELRKLKSEHPRAKVLCYVNTTAEVKAECDLCCTSGNAEKIVKKFLSKDDEVIFIPDKHLAGFVSKRTNRNFIIWPGYCPTHMKILPEDIQNKKILYPGAEVIVHPECTANVVSLADYVLSTEKMCRRIADSPAAEFIIGTETGILHRLKKEYPDRNFIPASEKALCPNMKKTTLEKILWSLERMEHEIKVPAEIADKARVALKPLIS